MVSENFQRGEQTREDIIHAAHMLFVQQGYHGTSMRQIAKQTGIALGGLYNHFSGKEAVFSTVFLEYHPYHEVLPAVLAASGETIEEYVRAVAARMHETLERRPDFMKLMFIEVVEFNSMHIRQLFSEMLPDLLKLAERIQATDRAKLRPISHLLLIRVYFGILFGYYLTEIIMAENASEAFSDDAWDTFFDVYLHGILRDS